MKRGGERRQRQRGEVRGKLIAAAQSLVREEGYEGLTIRKLAARIGYAPMSIYSYFPDKHAILLTLAEDVFDRLAQRLEAKAQGDPLEALRGALREYMVFALDNSNEYRTIFMTVEPTVAGSDKVEAAAAGNPALVLLTGLVQRCADAGLIACDAKTVATLLWTMTHGAVALLISFPDCREIDRDDYLDQVVDFAVAGACAQRREGG